MELDNNNPLLICLSTIKHIQISQAHILVHACKLLLNTLELPTATEVQITDRCGVIRDGSSGSGSIKIQRGSLLFIPMICYEETGGGKGSEPYRHSLYLRNSPRVYGRKQWRGNHAEVGKTDVLWWLQVYRYSGVGVRGVVHS